MAVFEPTEREKIRRIINENVNQVQFGQVKKVYAHRADNDNRNFEADVQLRTEEKTRRRIPIAFPAIGTIDVPEPGDWVLIDFMQGEGEKPIIRNSHYTLGPNSIRPPKGFPGLYRMRKGAGQTEREGDEFYLEADHLAKWMRMGYRKLETDETEEPDIWFGMYDPNKNDDEPPRAVASYHGTKYDLVGPKVSFSNSYIEELPETPATLGRFTLKPDQQLNVMSATLSDDTGEVGNNKMQIREFDTETVEREVFQQEPGTSEGSGFNGDPPITLDTSYETSEGKPTENGRSEAREIGEPVYSLSYPNRSQPTTVDVVIEFSGTGVSASFDGAIGKISEESI